MKGTVWSTTWCLKHELSCFGKQCLTFKMTRDGLLLKLVFVVFHWNCVHLEGFLAVNSYILCFLCFVLFLVFYEQILQVHLFPCPSLTHGWFSSAMCHQFPLIELNVICCLITPLDFDHIELSTFSEIPLSYHHSFRCSFCILRVTQWSPVSFFCVCGFSAQREIK